VDGTSVGLLAFVPAGCVARSVTVEECIREAERCERLAEEAKQEANRTILLEIASRWRKLAEEIAPKGDQP
jgi:hypothetical protein